jgi:hypothetical protein
VDQRESNLIADAVIAPDLAHHDLIVLSQTPRDFHHARRHIQMKFGAQLCQVRPLRQSFEVIDRLAGLDFDDSLQPAAALERQQHQIRIHSSWTGSDRCVLLVTGIYRDFEFAPQFTCSNWMRRSCSSCSRTVARGSAHRGLPPVEAERITKSVNCSMDQVLIPRIPLDAPIVLSHLTDWVE